MEKIKVGDIVEYDSGNQYVITYVEKDLMKGTIIQMTNRSKAAMKENANLNIRNTKKIIGRISELERVIYGIEY